MKKRSLYSSKFLEEDVCCLFWKQVEQLKRAKVIGKYDIFCISNNQRGNNVIRQVMDKRLGVTKGVADYEVVGIGYLEAKRILRVNKDGRVVPTDQEDEQKEFEQSVLDKGLKYATFHTPQMGVDILCQWLGVKTSS